jgi:hypothetical protein
MPRFIHRTTRPRQTTYPSEPTDPTWTVAAAHAVAQACAMGLVLPCSALHPNRNREENR